jgi:hypothetical protein
LVFLSEGGVGLFVQLPVLRVRDAVELRMWVSPTIDAYDVVLMALIVRGDNKASLAVELGGVFPVQVLFNISNPLESQPVTPPMLVGVPLPEGAGQKSGLRCVRLQLLPDSPLEGSVCLVLLLVFSGSPTLPAQIGFG